VARSIPDLTPTAAAGRVKGAYLWAAGRILLGWVFLWAFLDKAFALGFSTGFAYDPLDRLVVINYPAPDAEVIFMYDSRGDLLAATNSLGTTALRYDGLSRPVEVRFTFAQTVGYAYDAVGNRTRLTYADGRAPTSLARRTGHAGSGDPAGRAVDYAYDAAGRLAQARDWDRGLTAYTYDKRGLPATTRLPDGVTTTYAWDAAGRLTDLDHAFGSQTIAAYDYAYDRRGNRTQAVESLVPAGWAPDLPYKVYLPLVLQNAGPGLAPSGVAPSAATTIDYAYDPLGRLDAGVFGLCRKCGGPIGRERLDAMPYTPYCVRCGREVETGA